MSLHGHPLDDRLLAFCNGRLPESDVAELEGHIEYCPACIQRIGEIDQRNDRLVEHLRQSVGTMPAGDDALAGLVVASRFRLHSIVGRGAMGTVWRAEQTEPIQRDVAVKLIRAESLAPDVTRRFAGECRVLALMDHPNIAQVFEAGTFLTDKDGPRSYLAMELVRGVSIVEFCRIHQLELQIRLELFVSVCQAIQHAHQKGIIHRDIKPSNVLVAEYDGRPFAKVIDFGVAKAINSTDRALIGETTIGSIIGTPEYMSPEQAGYRDQDVDARSDVYALGALLYALLTGMAPIRQTAIASASWYDILRMIREMEPPQPSAVLEQANHSPKKKENPEIPGQISAKRVRGDLDCIVLKALEKDRNRRYVTANALAEDVGRFLRGDPVLAVRPSTQYRLQKFVRKHRGPAVAAGLFLAALVVGAAGTAIGFIRAHSEKQRALDAEAYAYRQAQRANDERAIAEKAAAKEREARLALSGNHVAVLSNFINLVTEHRSGKPGAFEKAVSHRLGEIEQWIDQAGIDDPQQAYSLHSSASDALQWLDELPRAIKQGKKALAIALGSFGTHDATTVNSYFRLAELHRLSKDNSAEADYRQQGHAAFAAMAPPTNAREREAQSSLMWYCREWIPESGRAVTLARCLLADARQRDEPLAIIRYQEALAWALQRNGRTDEALREQREVLMLAEKTVDESRQKSMVMNAQQLLINANRFDNDIYSVVRRTLGPDHVHHSLLAIGGSQRIHEQRWAEAEAMLRQCLTIRQAQQPDEWNTFNAMSLLGGCLLGQGSLSAAEPLLVAGFNGMRERASKIPASARPRITEAAQRLVDLYTRLDRPAEVAKWQALMASEP